MQKLRFVISSFTLLLVAPAVLSCGSGTSSLTGAPDPAARLQSITVSPATADAQMYPDGQVPFTATGNYVDPARIVMPQPAQWGVCQNGAPATAVTVGQTGVAQCTAGASGKYTVFAYDMTTCNAITACGGGCTIMGAAQLTCP